MEPDNTLAENRPLRTGAAPDPPAVTQAVPAAAKRHLVTMMFADLSGSTRLSAQLDAEIYAALLEQLGALCRRVIAAHGGSVVRVHGDGMLAMFGHPLAREDDARRATEAALDLHAAVAALRIAGVAATPGLRMHTGIHAGQVLVGEGDAVRGRYELSGIAPNIAARLSDSAHAGEVLVSEDSLGRRDAQRFIVSSRRLLQPQGAPAPITVLCIEGRATAAPQDAGRRPLHTPFIGRDDALRQLAAALASARAAKLAAVALVGAPGLGKTRLATEFLSRCEREGLRVLRGHCERSLGAQPLQPFQQMLRALLELPAPASDAECAAALQRHAPGWSGSAALLQRLLSPLSTPARGQASGDDARAAALSPQQMLDALVELFDAAAALHPLALFIDDWQWSDDASYQVLDGLLSIAGRGMLLLLATREPSLLQAPIQRVALQPLGDDEAAAAVQGWLPQADPFVITQICASAGGNPLFLEELCHRGADGQSLPRIGGPGSAWLGALIESRVARLDAGQRELTLCAAVIGASIPGWLFEQSTGIALDDARVAQLADADLIFPGSQPGSLRFKHGITRDVVYASVGLHERRALHARIAGALLARSEAAGDDGDHLEALAYHCDGAAQFADAARYAERAGDKATAASALDRAKAQYRAALDALDRLPELPARRWCSIAQRLAMASVFDPERAELPLFERSLELARAGRDPVAIARAHYWLGYLHYALGEAPTALDHIEHALDAARALDDPRLYVQVQATLGQALASCGRYDAALPLLDAAIAIKRQHRSGVGNAVGLTYSLACKGYLRGDQGDFDTAGACFEEALHDAQCHQYEALASVRGWYGVVLLWQGRWNEAQTLCKRAARDGAHVRSLHLMAMSRAGAAYARWCERRDARALDEVRDAMGWLDERGNGLFSSLGHAWLADIAAARGQDGLARRHAARALRRSRAGDTLGVGLACRAMASLAIARNTDDAAAVRARRWLARAQHFAALRGSRRDRAETQLRAAAIELDLHQPQRAAALLAEADTAFEAMQMAWHREQVRRLRERLPG